MKNLSKKELIKIRNEFWEKTIEIQDSKQIEYTVGNLHENVFHNFDEGAKLKAYGTSRGEIITFINKHLLSLLNYFRTCKTYSNESMESRISDIINYLILFIAHERTRPPKCLDLGAICKDKSCETCKEN